MTDPFAFDITEIDGFDNLHHPEGILREVQERAARLYGAREAFCLVNGSTAGILAAVSAALVSSAAGKAAEEAPAIVFARNAHKAAFHALYLNRARPVWLYPGTYTGTARETNTGADQGAHPDIYSGTYPGEKPGAFPAVINGRIDPGQLERVLEKTPEARAVMITSPTYDGVVSDIGALARVTHARGIPLVVDQAHGAHFGLHPALPENAVMQGADLVITSLHKTLPSLTQTGLLLLGGELVRPETVQRFLSVYQTSSPSYVLMASIDSCVGMMAREGKEILGGVLHAAEAFREKMKGLRHLFLLPADDPTRLLISAGAQLSGREICAILRSRFHIEVEMELPAYVLCLAGAGDMPEGFDRLYAALAWIDRALDRDAAAAGVCCGHAGRQRDWQELQERLTAAFTKAPESACLIHEAWDAGCRQVPVRESAGLVSGDFAYLYPPGMPLVIPGERISPGLADLLCRAEEMGFSINGLADLKGERIRVLDPQPADR